MRTDAYLFLDADARRSAPGDSALDATAEGAHEGSAVEEDDGDQEVRLLRQEVAHEEDTDFDREFSALMAEHQVSHMCRPS